MCSLVDKVQYCIDQVVEFHKLGLVTSYLLNSRVGVSLVFHTIRTNIHVHALVCLDLVDAK